MGQTCILTGMILNTMPVGEYDKRITILTRERGKITAFCPGSQKTEKFLAGGNEPDFALVPFEAYDGTQFLYGGEGGDQ